MCARTLGRFRALLLGGPRPPRAKKCAASAPCAANIQGGGVAAGATAAEREGAERSAVGAWVQSVGALWCSGLRWLVGAMVQVARRRLSGSGGGSASKRRKTAGGASAVDALFDEFRGPLDAGAAPEDADRIGPEGVEKFCEALGVSPASQTVLLLCWTMQASQMGFFSRSEWRRGFAALHAESVAELKKALPRLERSIFDRKAFHRFYEVRAQ